MGRTDLTIAVDIQHAPPAVPPMALIHITTVSIFRAICGGTGTLVPQLCPVMGSDLTYLFYGRPAYRPGKIDKTNMDRDSRPVCLSFRRDAIATSAGIYPCDTGAHNAKMYDRHLSGIPFQDLECSSVSIAEGRIVNRYFDNNLEYFYGDPRGHLVPNPTSTVAASFFNLLQDGAESVYDDRARTIEVIHAQEINLIPSLLGVILPDSLLSEPAVATWTAQCRTAGVQVKPYRPQSQTCAAREVERRFPEIAALQGLPQ